MCRSGRRRPAGPKLLGRLEAVARRATATPSTTRSPTRARASPSSRFLTTPTTSSARASRRSSKSSASRRLLTTAWTYDYFAKYRIDKSEFTPDENSGGKRAASSFATAPARRRRDRRARRYFAYQKKRAVELPPPTKPNRISIECYGLTMARGGGWIGSCLCGSNILRRVPRHRRGACSMAWRCRFLTARRHPTHWSISTQVIVMRAASRPCTN